MPSPTPGHPLPTLALVGRPNVGKSTLFNRIAGGRQALVAPIAGVTRDRRERTVARDGLRFRLVDTGGLGFAPDAPFSAAIAAQVGQAVAAADVVWLVVDGAQGPNPYDAEIARNLQRSGKPVLLIVNKAEGPHRLGAAGEFYALGLSPVLPVSALQGQGLAEALEESARRVPALRSTPGEPEPGAAVRVAFIGKPNVGKSSLINRILGQERFIVSEQAGTTREALEVPFTWNGRSFVLVDTAGIRRKARTKEMLEKFSVVNALTALEQVDVAVLVLDAAEGATEQDAHIADYIVQRERALVLALNKWDVVLARKLERRQLQADIAEELRFVDYAAQVRVSARTGSGLDRLFKEVQAAAEQFTRQVQTADLNRVLQMAVRQTAPPGRGKAATKVFYGVQLEGRPPRFRFFTNHPELIRPSYTRYLEHQLRYHLGFKGTPLGIQWRGRGPGKGKDGEGEEAAARSGRSR